MELYETSRQTANPGRHVASASEFLIDRFGSLHFSSLQTNRSHLSPTECKPFATYEAGHYVVECCNLFEFGVQTLPRSFHMSRDIITARVHFMSSQCNLPSPLAIIRVSILTMVAIESRDLPGKCEIKQYMSLYYSAWAFMIERTDIMLPAMTRHSSIYMLGKQSHWLSKRNTAYNISSDPLHSPTNPVIKGPYHLASSILGLTRCGSIDLFTEGDHDTIPAGILWQLLIGSSTMSRKLCVHSVCWLTQPCNSIA